jgi:hypothetical protein
MVGTAVLVSLWVRFYKEEEKAQVPKTVLIGISAGCLVMIAIGIWGYVHQ